MEHWVIRLFGRIKALKNILTALIAVIMPVINAFLIMLVIAAICEYWADRPRGRDSGGGACTTYKNAYDFGIRADSNHSIMGVTSYSDDAPYEFGKFDRALITMYRQVFA